VLYDDTSKSAGEKFTIADLIGIQKKIMIGKKTYPNFVNIN
jgi:prolyl-tRNA synthetase